MLQIYEFKDGDSYQAIYYFIRDLKYVTVSNKYVDMATNHPLIDKIAKKTKLPIKSAIIVLGCIIFSSFVGSPPVVDTDASPISMLWTYIGEIIFNMLILVGTVKMSDHIMKDMMGL